jgi:hypothetical protein
MTTKPDPDPDLDAIDAAEDAHVEAATGDQVRAALCPFILHLRDVHPEAVRDLLVGFGASGFGWIAAFRAPTRFGWTGKRYTQEVAAQIIPLLDRLCDLQANCALAYQKTKETL